MNAILQLPRHEDVLPEGFELGRGRLLEITMGAEANAISMKLGGALLNYAHKTKLGTVFGPDTVYRCFPATLRSTRKPDVSFVRKGRFPNDREPKGDIRLVPDLIAEVVSPNDNAYDLEEKIDDYLLVQVPLFWVIYPDTRTAYVYRSNGTITRLRGEDSLVGEDVLPGFVCRLADILPEPLTLPDGSNGSNAPDA
jgi:Uma2 family endonuclease